MQSTPQTCCLPAPDARGHRRLVSRGLSVCLGPLLSAALAAGALAEAVHVPGPAGPLEGESLAVPGARHVVVLIPGSGPINRDGNAPTMGLSSDTYRLLAEGLAAAGVASIRIDKRGFFGSAAAISDPNDVTIAAYAQDARDWVTLAVGLAPCVWLAGHSEGGLVALMAANAPAEGLCGLILISTSGRPMGRLLVEQMAANPLMAPLMADLDSIVTDLETGRSRAPSTIPPQLQVLFSPGLQRFMIDGFSHDPVQLAAGWAGPVLILQGDADLQVRPLDADLLAAAMPQARRVDLPGATHMLKADQPGQPFATYTDPTLPLHPGLIPAVTGFLGQHAPPP